MYGRKRVSKGALERLVTRANSKLLDNNSHLAIQRSANTYRLESDCPSPPAPQ